MTTFELSRFSKLNSIVCKLPMKTVETRKYSFIVIGCPEVNKSYFGEHIF